MTKRSPEPPKVPFSDNVGATLRRTRLQSELTLDQVATETKIQKRLVKALEQAGYPGLAHNVQSLGLLRRYARWLGLNDRTASYKYLAERGPLPTTSKPRRRPATKSPLIGTKLIKGLIIVFVLLVVVTYLVWQLLSLTGPPRLDVTQPANNSIIYSHNLTVAGQTTNGAEVSVNGQIIYVDDKGDFKTDIALSSGLNTITVVARNDRGQVSQIQLSVLVKDQ